MRLHSGSCARPNWIRYGFFLLSLLFVSVQGNLYIWRFKVQETLIFNRQSLQIRLESCSIAGCQEPPGASATHSHLSFSAQGLFVSPSLTRQKVTIKNGQTGMELPRLVLPIPVTNSKEKLPSLSSVQDPLLYLGPRNPRWKQ